MFWTNLVTCTFAETLVLETTPTCASESTATVDEIDIFAKVVAFPIVQVPTKIQFPIGNEVNVAIAIGVVVSVLPTPVTAITFPKWLVEEGAEPNSHTKSPQKP